MSEQLAEEHLLLVEEIRKQINTDHSQRVLERILRLAKFQLAPAVKVCKELDRIWKELEVITDEKILEEVDTHKLVFGGKDNQGRRIIHFYYKLHDPKQFSIENTLKFFLLMMDIALDEVDVQDHGIAMICWMAGSGWNNFDFASEKAFTDLFNSFDPLSLNMMSKMYLVDSPWYVWVAMKLMRPFITEETYKKIETISSQQLHAMFSADQLQENSIFKDTLRSSTSPKWH